MSSEVARQAIEEHYAIWPRLREAVQAMERGEQVEVHPVHYSQLLTLEVNFLRALLAERMAEAAVWCKRVLAHNQERFRLMAMFREQARAREEAYRAAEGVVAVGPVTEVIALVSVETPEAVAAADEFGPVYELTSLDPSPEHTASCYRAWATGDTATWATNSPPAAQASSGSESQRTPAPVQRNRVTAIGPRMAARLRSLCRPWRPRRQWLRRCIARWCAASTPPQVAWADAVVAPGVRIGRVHADRGPPVCPTR